MTTNKPVDPTCPWCLGDHQLANVEPGGYYRTKCCAMMVKAVDWDDGELRGLELLKA